MGSVLDAAQATVWGWRQLKTALCGGGSGLLARGWGPLAGQLMRAATGLHPGDREPEPGRGARKGLRLRCQWLSQSTVCAKGLEKALATQQVDPGATAPSPQAPGPRAPPFPPLLFKTGLCGYLSVLPACSSRLQSNADITRPGLLILPLTLFCHLVHH